MTSVFLTGPEKLEDKRNYNYFCRKCGSIQLTCIFDELHSTVHVSCKRCGADYIDDYIPVSNGKDKRVIMVYQRNGNARSLESDIGKIEIINMKEESARLVDW